MNINFKRALNFALADFYRNKGISVSAIFVLTLTTLLVTGLFFMGGISSYLIHTIQNKIDITAYFKEDAPEENILAARDEILNNVPNIKSVIYVSKEDALEEFLEKHKDSQEISKAVLEVGGSPFLPSLNIITTGNITQYENIAKVLENFQFADIIEKVDFSEKRSTINKILSVTSVINIGGLLIGLVLVLIALAVVFNTIKLIIDRSKDEINTMKIIGASKWFIRTPFVIEGGIFGLIAFIICLFLTIFAVYSLSYFLSVILPGFSLFGYFTANFLIVVAIQLICGVGLGVISSLIVVRKYLRI